MRAVLSLICAAALLAAACPATALVLGSPGLQRIQKLRPLAEAGNAEAELKLAALLEDSAPTEALTWLRRSAEHGQAEAQFRLAESLAESDDEKERGQAGIWLLRAAEQQHARAMTLLAAYYLESGLGLPQDCTKAVYWGERAYAAEAEESGNNLAWTLAICPDAALRNGPRAVEIALKAVGDPQQSNPGFIDTLAAAYAEAGRYTEAVEMQELAIRKLGNNRALRQEMQARLELYEAGQPYHLPPAGTASAKP